MTQTIEVDLGKILERIEQKLDKHIETTNESLTRIQINQARLEGKVETLDVKVETLQKGQNKIESELKDTKNEVSALYKWVIGTLIVAVIGVANIFLKFFDFLPK